MPLAIQLDSTFNADVAMSGTELILYLLSRASSADCRASRLAILADSCCTIAIRGSGSSERFMVFGALSAPDSRKMAMGRTEKAMLIR